MAALYPSGWATMSRRIETWQLRAKFATALSRMYGAEVPAYTTLVEVSTEVNRELGGSQRVTAERHGAIRVGTAAELADVADLFAAFGMYPVGFYDLRDAAPRCRWYPPRSGRSTRISWPATRSGCSHPCWPPPTRASSPPNFAAGSSGSWRSGSCSTPR